MLNINNTENQEYTAVFEAKNIQLECISHAKTSLLCAILNIKLKASQLGW